jgi:hypothetical protein
MTASAGTLLRTEAAMTEIPEDKPHVSQPDGFTGE